MLTESPPQKPAYTPAQRFLRRFKVLVAPDRLPLTIVIIGTLFRVAQYLFNRALWGDEAALALNIRNRSILQLFEPLDLNQAAPAGFLALVKISALLFGYNEYALRLIPLLSGLANLPLIYLAAKRFVKPASVPIALGLLAVADTLIYYSSELKQYSGDVTVALLLYLIIFFPLSRAITPLKALMTGLAGAFLMWFSHPALFVLAGIGMIFLVQNLVTRNWKNLGWLSITFSLWGLSFVAFYFTSLQAATSQGDLLAFHEVYFMPLPPFTPDNLVWLGINFFYTFDYPGSLGLAGLGAVLFIFGAIRYYKSHTSYFWALILPILFALLASSLHKYSFTGRLLLFLLPALYLLIAEGVTWIREIVRQPAPVIGVVLVVIMFVQPVAVALQGVGVPRTKEELRTVLTYYQVKKQPGDLMYVYYGGITGFDYYKVEMGLPKDCCVEGIMSRQDWSQYARDLDQLRGKPRVWVVISHTINKEEAFFKYYLDSMGKQLDSVQATDAYLYLYDLSSQKLASSQLVR